MNYALILAGGVGKRMRTSGMPKQFLSVFGKPIIIYTLEKFDVCADIDEVVIACNADWLDHMHKLIDLFAIKKVTAVVPGGKDRQGSVENGMAALAERGCTDDDVVVIHDGVRPLIQPQIISENVRVTAEEGCAMTVSPVIESVVVTKERDASFDDFQKRDDTYKLTAPQSFRFGILKDLYKRYSSIEQPIPLLDSALIYTYLGHRITMVPEDYHNIKITTPEDYYILKALLELQENKNVFGLD